MNVYLEDKNTKLPKFHNVDEIKKLIDGICNVHAMIIFTNNDLSKVIAITNNYKITKDAKVGNISPIEVILKAGPTGMDSSQIELFQALKIQTKVMKNQLEIINDSKVLVVGQKINISEINLMKKFNIKPYVHEVIVKVIYMSGKLYNSDILKINDEVLKSRVLEGIKKVACFSFQAGLATKASAPHTVMKALTNLMGLKNFTGVDVPCLKGGAVVASSAPVAEVAKDDKKGGKDDKKGGKKEEPKKKEPEPVADEEFEGGMGDLFG